MQEASGDIKYTYHLVPAIAASVPAAALEGLRKNPNVVRVELDAELDNAWGVRQLGADTPTGNTEFQFKGVGTINGEGNYRFMLWAGDGTGTDGADTFRIRIWTEDEFGAETDVYDNGTNQDIGDGSIVVHTKKK